MDIYRKTSETLAGALWRATDPMKDLGRDRPRLYVRTLHALLSLSERLRQRRGYPMNEEPS